jgi:hypothetical protein
LIVRVEYVAPVVMFAEVPVLAQISLSFVNVQGPWALASNDPKINVKKIKK